MPQGKLEVLLISAKGLENTDFLNDMDPYVVITCRTQEQKSSVASGKGSDPEWNENFVFTVSDAVSELSLKILDSDVGTQDDFVGEATIPLEAVFTEGSLPPMAYNVVKDEEYRGEIRIGLNYTPELTALLFKLVYGIRKGSNEVMVVRKKALEDGRSLHVNELMMDQQLVSSLISTSVVSYLGN